MFTYYRYHVIATTVIIGDLSFTYYRNHLAFQQMFYFLKNKADKKYDIMGDKRHGQCATFRNKNTADGCKLSEIFT